MKIRSARLLTASFAATALLLPAGAGWAQSGGAGGNHPCASLLQTDAPHAFLSNGLIDAAVYLPDAQRGYYRAARFDWSGVVPCLSYKGHTYFGVWFPHYDPLVADAITGPVEEFKSEDGGLGYDAAKPDGLFVKPGVGVLRKVNDAPYGFMFPYPIVDTGKWSVHAGRSEISFTQHLRSTLGYAYAYTKTLRLEKGQPVLVIRHRMKNTGTKIIDTDVYEHDFFVLDHAPTGPGMALHFAFAPHATRPLGHGAEIEGNEIVFHEELKTGQTVQSPLTGFSGSPSDYDFTLENRNTGVGVEQWGDSPIAYFNLWSIRTTIAPEAYVHLYILPGKTQDWSIRYRFFAK
jgi:hypothetical protein